MRRDRKASSHHAPGSSRGPGQWSRQLGLGTLVLLGDLVALVVLGSGKELDCYLGRTPGLCAVLPLRERESGRVRVPARYRGSGRRDRRRRLELRATSGAGSRPWGADGQTHPGKDFSHGVSLCGFDLCDCHVLGLSQHSGVQVFTFLVLPSPRDRRLLWEPASGPADPVGLACVPDFFIAMYVCTRFQKGSRCSFYLPFEENL